MIIMVLIFSRLKHIDMLRLGVLEARLAPEEVGELLVDSEGPVH